MNKIMHLNLDYDLADKITIQNLLESRADCLDMPEHKDYDTLIEDVKHNLTIVAAIDILLEYYGHRGSEKT